MAIGAGYAVSLAVGFARHGLREPIGDPVLAVMEALTLLSAVPIVTLMAAIVDRAARDRRVFGTIALVFGALCAGTTAAVHFMELTAARQLGEGGIVWPSRAYAAELLAWDVFLGLAMVFAAPVFEGGGRQRPARRGLLLCGALCLIGAIGPVLGNMRLQLVGVFGYACVMPIVAYLLAKVFTGGVHSDAETAD